MLQKFLVSLCLMGLGLPSFSQNQDLMELSLEELMSLTIKTNKGIVDSSLKDSVLMTYIIDHQEIIDAGSLQEALNRGPHSYRVYNANYDGVIEARGNQSTLDGDTKLIMVDGIPLSLNSWDGPGDIVLQRTLPLILIDRIEITYGPGSVEYGTNSFLLTVNIITRQPEGNLVETDLWVGDNGKAGIELFHRHQKGFFTARSALRLATDDGFEQQIQTAGDYYSGQIFNREQFNFSTFLDYKALSLTLMNTAQTDGIWIIPQPEGFGENRTRTWMAELAWRKNITDNWYIKPSLAYMYKNQPWELLQDRQADLKIKNRDTYLRIDSGFLLPFKINGIGGYEGAFLEGYTPPPNPFSEPWRYQRNRIYLQFDKSLRGPQSKYRFLLGAQHNTQDDSKENTSLRGGFVWMPSESSSFTLSHSEGFRAPVWDELGSTDANFFGGPLDSQTIRSTDARYQFFSHNFYFSVAGYYAELHDLIGTEPVFDNPDVNLRLINIAETRYLRGAEFYARTDLNNWHVTASLSYQDNKQGGVANATLMPNWTGQVYASKTINSIRVSTHVRWLDRFYEHHIDQALDTNIDLQSHYQFILNAHWNVADRLVLSAHFNLGEKQTVPDIRGTVTNLYGSSSSNGFIKLNYRWP